MEKNRRTPCVTKLALLLASSLFSSVLPAQEDHSGHAMPGNIAHAHEAQDSPAHNRDGAAKPETLEPVVVTAPQMDAPLEASFDPRAPQQPLPANDGASLLKTVPGMNVIRKGGTDGDPVFRGMAASRLNILLDGEQILGGCGGRMDPPTAYIFPDAYDRVTVLKGPQSVIHGPAQAGVVLFERKHERFERPGWRLNTALTTASFGRVDGFFGIKGGNSTFYGEGIVTRARSGDYRDGSGDKVHSRYERHSGTAIVGLTPGETSRLELSAIRSDAEAAYADRGMDGSSFKRENYALKFEKSRLAGWLDKVEAQAYYNYIDHVMDNYSLRHGAATPMASNPDRKTVGGRIALTLLPSSGAVLKLGGDLQGNKHTGRSGSPGGMPGYYRDKARVANARFENIGLFSELTWQVAAKDRLIGGLRIDRWRARDMRPAGSHASRRETLNSGFIRYERDFSGGTLYAGLGHSARAPDFWEIVKNGHGTPGVPVFATLKPEKTTQLDFGTTFQSGPWQGFVSAFYGRIGDYILIETGGIARNIDATTWGGEAGVGYRFSPAWKGTASLAYVHGENGSDGHALGQMPPLEGRLGAEWRHGPWSAGALWRLVAAQNRYATGQGNIVGQDLGRSEGFGVFSINGGYRLDKAVQIMFGVDNLFGKTYAEFISRSGEASMIQGYEQSTRVNEPGRVWWLRAQIDLD